MLPYNAKLWQYPLERLTTEWCAPFVPLPNPEEVLKGAYGGKGKKRKLKEDEAGLPEDSEDDEPEDECDHEEYEADILTGVATCGMCGHRWHQTPQDIERENERRAAYEKWEATNANDEHAT